MGKSLEDKINDNHIIFITSEMNSKQISDASKLTTHVNCRLGQMGCAKPGQAACGIIIAYSGSFMQHLFDKHVFHV